MSAREVILDRVRAATADVDSDVSIDWRYGQPTDIDDVVTLFDERVTDYKATVIRCPANDVGHQIVAALTDAGISTAVCPPGLPWLEQVSGRVAVTVEDPAALLTPTQLNEIDAVVTASAVGIAETGTVVLDHRDDQGRRAISLVPDLHVCVVRADQIVTDVPEAVARLESTLGDGHPLTWISGGSATSDIELSRVEGVHGPRKLVVIIAE